MKNRHHTTPQSDFIAFLTYINVFTKFINILFITVKQDSCTARTLESKKVEILKL